MRRSGHPPIGTPFRGNSAADEFFEFVGERFAPGWAELRGRGTKDVAWTAALNMVSVGGSLQLLSGDDRAQVLIAGWPASEILSELVL